MTDELIQLIIGDGECDLPTQLSSKSQLTEVVTKVSPFFELFSHAYKKIYISWKKHCNTRSLQIQECKYLDEKVMKFEKNTELAKESWMRQINLSKENLNDEISELL